LKHPPFLPDASLVNPMNQTPKLRPELQTLADRLPGVLTLYEQAPAVVTRYFFPVSKKTLARRHLWPLPRKVLNGLVCVSTIELLLMADAKLAAPPAANDQRAPEELSV
jgi:hypothetical protein